MTGFSADWLTRREAIDAVSRSEGLTGALGLAAGADGALHAVDLGAGTGANFRYLAPRLGGRQQWRLVDDDPGLLSTLLPLTRSRMPGAHVTASEAIAFDVDGPGFGCTVACERLDLAAGLHALPLPRAGLVTASALLDLVSGSWLEALAERCAAAGASVLFALTYDGRIACTPPEPDDGWVRDLVNRHQRLDKGFGPALGPAAAAAAVTQFERLGYRLRSAHSDWRLGAAQAALQRALLDGWLGAALELVPEQSEALGRWHRRRLEHVEAGRSEIVVGHSDFAGRPGLYAETAGA